MNDENSDEVGTPVDCAKVEAAIVKGIDALIKNQRPNGSWPGDNLAGPQFSAQWLIAKRHFGTLDKVDEEAITGWVLKQQRPDGGFPASWDIDESSFPTSLTIRFAVGEDYMSLKQKELLDAYIARQGGIANSDSVTLIFGCIAGHIEPKALGSWSMIQRLIPGIDRVMGKRFSATINMVMVALPAIVQSLQAGAPLGKGFHPIKRIEWRSALAYLTSHQNPCGSWLGMLSTTILGMLALEALGVKRDDPRLAKAIAYLDHYKLDSNNWAGAQIVPWTSEVWNTAAAVRTLLKIRQINHLRQAVTPLTGSEYGHDPTLEVGDHDENIHRGINYLLEQQSTGVPRDWFNFPSGVPTDGGWAYEDSNPKGADCDTTSAVAYTLFEAQRAGLCNDVDGPIRRGMMIMDTMQNDSGGWPAFTHGLKQKPPGPQFETPLKIAKPTLWTALKMFLNPPLNLGDSAWADLTGRVIGVYAKLGRGLDDPAVSKAVAFVRKQLGDQPGWWGRWEVNYVMASSYVLSGLARVKYDITQKWVTDVGEWVEACQNPDGGWGETILSYQDPRLAGVGESMSGVTASVLEGLLDMNWTDHESVNNGVNFLLNAQLPDGRWGRQKSTGVMMPPDQFYSNRIYTECVCLGGLSRYHYKVVTGTHQPEHGL